MLRVRDAKNEPGHDGDVDSCAGTCWQGLSGVDGMRDRDLYHFAVRIA